MKRLDVVSPEIIIAFLLLLLAVPISARADGVNGYMEYNYGITKSNAVDVSGVTSTKSSSLSQRYSLELDKSLTSTMRLTTGANVQLSDSHSEINGETSDASSSRISPHIDLSLASGFFSAAVGFNRRIDNATNNGESTPSIISDSYSGRLTWSPVDFPNLNLTYSVFNNYDENHQSQDSTSTSLTFSTHYKPLQSLDINYSGNNSTTTNRLNGFESDSLTQSLRTDYSDVLFKDRVVISSSYNISTQKSVTTRNSGANPSAGGGLLIQQLVNTNTLNYPLYSISSNPSKFQFQSPDQFPDFSSANPLSSNLPPDTILITTPTASANPDLVNLGIKFTFPQAVNLIRLLVNATFLQPRDLTTADYSAISAAFSGHIKVYTSANGFSWNLWPGTPVITFNSFVSAATNQPSPAFDLQLPNPSKTAYNYIKIEITPVGVDNIPLPSILQKLTVTKLEAYLQDQATSLAVGSSRTSTSIGGTYNMNLRARLWDEYNLTFDSGFDLNHNKTDTSDFTYRYSLVNGLNFFHIINSKLSANARLSRQDDINPSDNTSSSSNAFSLSFAANPLPTLNHTLNYSFRQEKSDTLSKTTQAVNLSNSAELYHGINLGLNIGGSLSSDSTGKDQKSLLSTLALNLVPHRTVSINLAVSDQESWQSGGDTRPDNATSVNRSADATITFNPVPAIYLFGTYNVTTQTHQGTQTSKSIGGSWSPFKGGDLQLNTSYHEGYQPDGTKDRTFTQSAHLTIRPGTYLDLAYLIARSAGAGQSNDVESLSASLRISF